MKDCGHWAGPKEKLMAEFAPNIVDSRDPALASFLDAAEFEKRLERLATEEWDWGSVQEIQTRVLKCHPGKRCTFEIAMSTSKKTHELIGKVFAEDRSDVHDIMAGIQRAGFGGNSKFAIPGPITYLPSFRVLLEEKVCGTSAREIFLGAESHLKKETAEHCARWLARFHSADLRIGPVWGTGKLMFKSTSQARKLSRLGGLFAEKSGHLLEKLESLASNLGVVEICAAHGEYNPSHVLLDGNRTVVIDWDGGQVRDPARDVATFMVVTKWLALDRRRAIGAFDSLSEAFLQAYLVARGRDILERLPFHLGALCLKHAKYCAAYQFERWEEKTMTMLEEGLSAVGLAY